MQQERAVKPATHAHDAIEGLSATRLLDCCDKFSKYPGAFGIRVPVRQYVLLEADAMIANPGSVKSDLAITGVHHTIAADSVVVHLVPGTDQ